MEIVTFDTSYTTEEAFDEIDNVILGGISYHMWYVVNRGYF